MDTHHSPTLTYHATHTLYTHKCTQCFADAKLKHDFYILCFMYLCRHIFPLLYLEVTCPQVTKYEAVNRIFKCDTILRKPNLCNIIQQPPQREANHRMDRNTTKCN